MESGQRTRSTAQVIPLEVVRDHETPTEIKAGRKRKLTPAIFEKIMTAIEEGARVTTICREYGIAPRTLFMRVGLNPEEAKRFTEAKQISWHDGTRNGCPRCTSTPSEARGLRHGSSKETFPSCTRYASLRDRWPTAVNQSVIECLRNV
jgi:transposase-like protein